MTPQDEQSIREWAQRHHAPVQIIFSRGRGAPDEQMAAFVDRFKALVPDARILNAPDDAFRVPALMVGRHANIAYQAAPQGKELPPFLEALAAAGATVPARIEVPAELTVYIAMQCPHCPEVVRRLSGLAQSEPLLRIAVVDGMLFAQDAAADGIRSVPTLILDEQIRWVGRIDMREVVDQLVRRDPTRMSAASLRQMLEAGDAERAAVLMIGREQIFPALIDLLVHERWSVRLGAMVTVEYLADQAPELAGQLIAPLWERFDDLAEPVQGDMVHIFGQVGSDIAKAHLHHIAAGDGAASVKEAALEELEDL